MADWRSRAAEAKSLLEHEGFVSVCAEILDDAGRLFLNASSGIDEIAKAHERVRAVQLFKDAIQNRLTEETVQKRKEAQDRAND